MVYDNGYVLWRYNDWKTRMKYSIRQLPGEQYYRQFFNDLELQYRQDYRAYQDWRMKLGIAMSDIDALVSDQSIESFGAMKNIEYDTNVDGICHNYAILEMKHWRTNQSVIDKIVKGSNPSKSLANDAKLPLFVVKYVPAQENDNKWEFTVYNANVYAEKYLPAPKHMSERQFIIFLFSLRDQKPPVELIKNASCERSQKWSLNTI